MDKVKLEWHGSEGCTGEIPHPAYLMYIQQSLTMASITTRTTPPLASLAFLFLLYNL